MFPDRKKENIYFIDTNYGFRYGNDEIEYVSDEEYYEMLAEKDC